MDHLAAAGALDVTQVLWEERGAFVRLLGSLNPAEWDAETECPGWSVKGIALHVLGDDLSLLSRQRDAATNSLALMAEEEPDWDSRELLDGFNERWVHRANFMSPRLVIELLGVAGQLTADFYATVDPGLPGEPVPFVGPEPAPYWMIAAREYAERWIHHLQITRATSRPGPVGSSFVIPAVAALMRGFPAALSLLPAKEGDRVSFVLDRQGPAWTLAKETQGWRLYDGLATAPTVRVDLSAEVAAALFSRGLHREAVVANITVVGDSELPELLMEGLAVYFARS